MNSKNILIIIFLTVSYLIGSSQDQRITNSWLPEKYVNAVLAKDTNANNYLIPVEGFESLDNNTYILMYRGELNPLKTEKTMIEGREKFKLLNLQYFVNLKYNSKELVDRISKADVYYSFNGERLLLEIVEKGKTEEIYFINQIDGYQFRSIKDAKKFLLKKR